MPTFQNITRPRIPRGKHGHAGIKSAEYRAWKGMNTRCYNPNRIDYDRYGGRGITVCERWWSFENFLADMGEKPSPRHSIERRNNDGNYEPDNCYWATRREQNINTRRNHPLVLNGRTQLITDWAQELGIHHMTLYRRLESGWSVERTLTTPARYISPKGSGAQRKPKAQSQVMYSTDSEPPPEQT